MNIGLFEDSGYRKLLPLTWLRACFELRCGRDLLIEKVRRHAAGRVTRVWVREVLRETVAERLRLDQPHAGQSWCVINARALISGAVDLPAPGVVWMHNSTPIAVGLTGGNVEELSTERFLDEPRLSEWAGRFRVEPAPAEIRLLEYPWHAVLSNPGELRRECAGGGS